MKKILILLFLTATFYNAIAQKTDVADTIVVGNIEKCCPGGFEAFNNYIAKYVRAPPDAYGGHKVGTTYISFVIEPDGNVSNVVTMLAAGYGMDEEAARVISASNHWLPVTIDDKPVRTLCRAAVEFFGDFPMHKMWVRAKAID